MANGDDPKAASTMIVYLFFVLVWFWEFLYIAVGFLVKIVVLLHAVFVFHIFYPLTIPLWASWIQELVVHPKHWHHFVLPLCTDCISKATMFPTSPVSNMSVPRGRLVYPCPEVPTCSYDSSGNEGAIASWYGRLLIKVACCLLQYVVRSFYVWTELNSLALFGHSLHQLCPWKG